MEMFNGDGKVELVVSSDRKQEIGMHRECEVQR